MDYSPLEASILRTLSYFDLLDYPLTATETWKWLHRPDVPADGRSLAKVAEALEHSEAFKPYVSRTEGFYHLSGREAIVPQRKRRNLRVDHQLRTALRMVKLLRLIPSIRMIAVYSSLAIGNVKETSDIDLLVVARKERIWFTRLWVAGLLKLLRKRPDPSATRDRFCLSFYITDDALNVERGAFGPDDIGFAYYMQTMLPLYDPDGTFARFREANPWLAKEFPNGTMLDRLTPEVRRPGWLRVFHRVFEAVTWPFFNGLFSDWYCNLQLKILPVNLKSLANIDSRVIISDTMLKFHDKDTRHALRKRWQEKISSYDRHSTMV